MTRAVLWTMRWWTHILLGVFLVAVLIGGLL